MSLSRKKDLAPVLIALAVFLIFSFAPQARFLDWDDVQNLVVNDKWRGLTWENLKWMWTTHHYGPWQPLSWFSWALDFKIWGLDPAAFRRTNVTLHAITAGFLYLIIRRLRPQGFPFFSVSAAGAALFFGLHPLRVESVVWITERRDVLSGFFSLFSIWLWLKDRRSLSAVAFAGAVLSKGTSIAVVPFIFVIEVFMRRISARKSVASLLPHAVIGLFAACRNLNGFSTGELHGLGLSICDRILVSMSGAWFYVSKTFMPVNLSPYYALSLNGDGIRLESYPGALLALALTGACLHRTIRSWAAPIWFAYLLALAPVSGLFQNGRQAAADRYSYLSCLPFALLYALMLERLEVRRPRVAAGVVILTAVILSTMTLRQAHYWRDDVSLWTRAVDVEPNAYLPNSNLSVALLVDGRGSAAVPYLENAIRLEPRDAEARVNLASILAAHDRERAIVLFREAVALRPEDPTFASARYNLGVLLVAKGLKSDGLAQMREAVRLDPSLSRR